MSNNIEVGFKSIEPCIDKLKGSPTFAMSLGAKELFHTNFLAFLLETDEQSISAVSQKLKELFFDKDPGEVWVFREKHNLDLVVVPKNRSHASEYSAVVIEAKLKSIPTTEQLAKYDARINKGFNLAVEDQKYDNLKFKYDTSKDQIGCVDYRVGRKVLESVKKSIRRILLSPTQLSDGPSWKFMDWNKLSSALKAGLKTDLASQGNRTKMFEIVESYSDDLECILKLLEAAEEFVEDFCEQLSDVKFGEFNDTLREWFLKLRLHDLMSKYAYWHLSNKLKEFVGDAEIEVGLSHSIPLLSFRTSLKGGAYRIGVQIQGGQYRHYIESIFDDESLKNFIEEGNYLDRWFNKGAQRIESIDCLNRFGENKFRYSWIDISKFNFKELSEHLVSSFETINALKQNP